MTCIIHEDGAPYLSVLYIHEDLCTVHGQHTNCFFLTGSTEPRSPRPVNVKYHVGQVVQHKKLKYRGVIIGWDAVAKVDTFVFL